MTLISYALRSMLRGGQRTLLAVGCIAFGVLALTAMSLLAGGIAGATFRPTASILGGDVIVRPPSRLDEESGLASDQLQRWQDDGLVTAVDVRQQMGGLILLRNADSGRGYPLFVTLAVDPQTYPLVGEVDIVEPRGAALADIVQPGQVVLTQDVAEAAGVSHGDVVRVGGADAGAVEVPVGGIVSTLPSGQGRGMLLHADDATLLQGVAAPREQIAFVLAERDTASVRAAAEAIGEAGWGVENRIGKPPGSTQEEVMDTTLKGAGLLGLLLGGVGVAGALQVLLAARRRELATLRAVGYRRGHLVGLIGIEMGLMGVIGALVGLAGGITVARGLANLFGRLAATRIDLDVTLSIVLTALAAGVVTTLLFGTYAVLRASSVRPADLFREVADVRTRSGQARVGVLWALILGLFGLLASIVLGSLLQGFGVILFGLLGLGVVGGLLVLAVQGVAKLPLPGGFLSRMARTGLARQPTRTLTAGVALFAGSLAIGLALAIISGASDQLEGRFDASDDVPIQVFAGSMAPDSLLGALQSDASLMDAPVVSIERRTSVRSTELSTVIEGRVTILLPVDPNAPDSVRYDGHKLTGGRWPEPGEIALGIQASEIDSMACIGLAPDAPCFPVVGRFQPDALMAGLVAAIVHPSDASAIAGSSTQAVSGYVSRSDHDAQVQAIGQAFPGGMVFSRLDIERLINGVFLSLFWFVVGMSALAGLAGIVLISNAVGMALVERRREMGMLQSIGYRRGHILSVLAMEYGLVGFVAGVAGAGVTALVLIVLDHLSDGGADIFLTWPQAFLLVAITTALAAGCALLTAAPTIRGRPLRLLRASE